MQGSLGNQYAKEAEQFNRDTILTPDGDISLDALGFSLKVASLPDEIIAIYLLNSIFAKLINAIQFKLKAEAALSTENYQQWVKLEIGEKKFYVSTIGNHQHLSSKLAKEFATYVRNNPEHSELALTISPASLPELAGLNGEL